MITFYARLFLTYGPFLGLKGVLGLFFVVRYYLLGKEPWQRKANLWEKRVWSGGRAGALGTRGVSGVGPGRCPGQSCYRREKKSDLYCLCLCAVSARFLESHWFVWVTQMNHIPMHIDHDRNMDWVSIQVRDGHPEDLG